MITDSLATELRILNRILQETWGGLKRTGWMNLVIVVTMASILSIFGTLFASVIETQLFLENVGAGLKISAYVDDKGDVDKVKADIQKLDGIKKVELISKDAAWEDMKKHYNVPDIKNPLPDTLHVQVKKQDEIETMATKIHEIVGVESVNYAKTVLQKLKGASRLTSIAGLGVSIFFGTLTLFIISNTIHLLIEARQREIEILRMMGVGNWYIRSPFLLQGAVYGLVGAAIAYIPLSIAQHYINQVFEYFQFTSNSYSVSVVLMTLILIGIVMGAGGAAVSVHRYLKV